MDCETVQRVRDILRGAECISIQNEGGFLLMQFSKCKLSIGCSWRIVRGELISGSGSNYSANSKRLESVIGTTVEDVAVVGETNDLRLLLNDGSSLETFEDADDYENWTLSTGGVGMIVSGPGTLWSSF